MRVSQIMMNFKLKRVYVLHNRTIRFLTTQTYKNVMHYTYLFSFIPIRLVDFSQVPITSLRN